MKFHRGRKTMSRRRFLGNLAGLGALPIIGCAGKSGLKDGLDAGPGTDTDTDVGSDTDTGTETDSGGDTDTGVDTDTTESPDGGTDTDTQEEWPRYFCFAVIADTHIIDGFYVGPEGNALDTETIFQTEARLIAARNAINALQLEHPVELVNICGDVIHNYPSPDLDFYFQNTTRFDICKGILDGFAMPYALSLGTHDYDVPSVSRQMTHELFLAKFGVAPYYYLEHKGWRFIHLNNQLGDSWNPDSSSFDTSFGSFGEEQLNWLDAVLAEGKPSFVFWHFPWYVVWDVELFDLGLRSVLNAHADVVKLTVTGHSHRWINLGSLLGPKQIVCGSTRYDQDAMMIFRVDRETETYEILNWNCFHWLSTETDPFVP
jgi:hypothetical protein